MSQLDFILITNFGHQPISQTKKDFAFFLEDNTDILHYRRMPGTGLELIVPRWQKASVMQQLRQLQFELARNYHPTNPMVRRRPEESAAQAREREVYCAHRAFKKVAEAERTNRAVRDWFQSQVDKLEANFPKVFEEQTHNAWMEKLIAEAMARRAAETTAAGETAGNPEARPHQAEDNQAGANNGGDQARARQATRNDAAGEKTTEERQGDKTNATEKKTQDGQGHKTKATDDPTTPAAQGTDAATKTDEPRPNHYNARDNALPAAK